MSTFLRPLSLAVIATTAVLTTSLSQGAAPPTEAPMRLTSPAEFLRQSSQVDRPVDGTQLKKAASRYSAPFGSPERTFVRVSTC
jgi:hypothetical protein